VLAFPDLDGEELALVVPLVDRRIGVEPLVALQADERGIEGAGQGPRHLGLADPGVALQQQGAAKGLHERERHGQLAVGDIGLAGQSPLQLLARERRALHAFRAGLRHALPLLGLRHALPLLSLWHQRLSI
jgi:hypothetical protein